MSTDIYIYIYLPHLQYHMYTDWPDIYTYEQNYDRLFVNPGRNDNIYDTPSKAWWWSPAHLEWLSQQQFIAQYVDAQVESVRLTMQMILTQCETDLIEEQSEIEAHKDPSGRQFKRWKTKQRVYQLKDSEKMDQTSPNTEEVTYAGMLQDV